MSFSIYIVFLPVSGHPYYTPHGTASASLYREWVKTGTNVHTKYRRPLLVHAYVKLRSSYTTATNTGNNPSLSENLYRSDLTNLTENNISRSLYILYASIGLNHDRGTTSSIETLVMVNNFIVSIVSNSLYFLTWSSSNPSRHL